MCLVLLRKSEPFQSLRSVHFSSVGSFLTPNCMNLSIVGDEGWSWLHSATLGRRFNINSVICMAFIVKVLLTLTTLKVMHTVQCHLYSCYVTHPNAVSCVAMTWPCCSCLCCCVASLCSLAPARLHSLPLHN